MRMNFWLLITACLVASVSIFAQEVAPASTKLANGEIIGIIATILLCLSEALPFFKKFEGNGIFHTIIVVLKSLAKKEEPK